MKISDKLALLIAFSSLMRNVFDKSTILLIEESEILGTSYTTDLTIEICRFSSITISFILVSFLTYCNFIKKDSNIEG